MWRCLDAPITEIAHEENQNPDGRVLLPKLDGCSNGVVVFNDLVCLSMIARKLESAFVNFASKAVVLSNE
ncbi:MAG TPA: hypothetical protein VFW11_06595 [Cyclobacteriaceae bacterium]|nr:hypothetical protein [Cyclobacteriaceae bacterium]